MKQAYLITAYKDAKSLSELAHILSDSAYVYIHVDQKSRTITEKDIERLNAIPGCKAIRKYDIKWGGFAHIQAILELVMMAASNDEVAYMHMLTGEDFLLASPKELDAIFLDCDEIYMTYIEPRNLPETVTKRYLYYNWFQDKNVKNKVLWTLQNMTVLLQKKLGVCRKGIGEFTQIYKGLVYISMPKEAAKYVIEYVARHDDFWDDLYKCQVPEEFFFQTIFMNHEFWSQKVMNRELRYMDWSRGDGASPCYLTENDYDKVKESGCLFARKFHPEISEALRKRLKEELNLSK